ncbi:MAG: pyridoxamine 5'-phosphate oxidase [Phycisphaerales bacterium]
MKPDPTTFDHPPASPGPLFGAWLDYARTKTEAPNWNAMALATATDDGAPSVRMVLLKEWDLDAMAITFYTNYESRKASELDANPRLAVVLHWDDLERQLRVRGVAERADDETSDRYFASRDRLSQLGAWASAQSHEVEKREELEQRLREFEERHPPGEPVPRPPHWGGYVITALEVEFWLGKPGRLHERLRYDRDTPDREEWRRRFLQP